MPIVDRTVPASLRDARNDEGARRLPRHRALGIFLWCSALDSGQGSIRQNGKPHIQVMELFCRATIRLVIRIGS